MAEENFIFGGNTGLTYEELKKRRAVAAALAARQQGAPKNIGEGLTYLGNSIGEAVRDWRLEAAEQAQRKRSEEYNREADRRTQQQVGGNKAPAAPNKPGDTGAVTPNKVTTTPETVANPNKFENANVENLTSVPVTNPPLPPFFGDPTPREGGPQITTVSDDSNLPSSFLDPTPMKGAAPIQPLTAGTGYTPGPGMRFPSQPMYGLDSTLTPSPAPRAAGPSNMLVTPPASSDVQGNPTAAPAVGPRADAPTGFRAAPSYIQQAILENESDPTMQAYLGHLASREAPVSASQVSPTGARGPFQFTSGTGAQYGLVRGGTDMRADLGASVRGAAQLTRDNAAAFTERVGRPPTFSELALMHQQGGVTGANMVMGTGNAPSGNLAVNNIPSGASPSQAVQRIAQYYGMPEGTLESGPGGGSGTSGANSPQGSPPTSREGVIRALMESDSPITAGAQDFGAGAEVPQVNPTQAEAGTPPTSTSQALISAAAGSRRRPGVQVASLDPAAGIAAVAPPEAAKNPPITTDIPVGPDTPQPQPQPQQVAANKVTSQRIVPDTSGVPADAPSRLPIPDASKFTEKLPLPGAAPVRPPIVPALPGQDWLLRQQNNPYLSENDRADAGRRWQILEARRKEMEAIQNNDYENDRAQHNIKVNEYRKWITEEPTRALKIFNDLHQVENIRADLEKKYYEAGIPRQQAKEKADLEIKQARETLLKTMQETSAKELKEVDGVFWERTKATRDSNGNIVPAGPWQIAEGSPKPKDKTTESQAKVLMGFRRGVTAASQLGNTDILRGLVDTTAGKVPIAGNYWVTPEYQKTASAAYAWIRHVIRTESGAVIGPHEIADHYPVYFPVPNDSDQVVAEKAVRRREALKSLYDGLGEAKAQADAFLADRKTRKTDKPEGSLRRSNATGKMEQVIGGHWEPQEQSFDD